MNTLRTSLEDFLAPFAVAAMKIEAEKVIEEKVQRYRKQVTEAVFNSLKDTAIKFVEFQSAKDMKLNLAVIFEDRRTK